MKVLITVYAHNPSTGARPPANVSNNFADYNTYHAKRSRAELGKTWAYTSSARYLSSCKRWARSLIGCLSFGLRKQNLRTFRRATYNMRARFSSNGFDSLLRNRTRERRMIAATRHGQTNRFVFYATHSCEVPV